MTVSHNLCSVALLFCLFSAHIHAQIIVLSKPSDTVHVEAGKILSLVVKFRYKGNINLRVTWYFNLSKRLYVKDYGKDIEDQTSWTIGNASLNNSGIYTLSWSGSSPRNDDSFVVVVQKKPTAVVRCSSNSVIAEGKSILCYCEGINGNPQPRATWWRNGKLFNKTRQSSRAVLDFKSVSRYDAGIYTCRTQSHVLKDEKELDLIVKSAPWNISFSSYQRNETVIFGKSATLVCRADSYPSAIYSILLNGKELSSVNGLYAICSSSYFDIGRYECVARNNIGTISASIFLDVVSGQIYPRNDTEAAEPTITPKTTHHLKSTGNNKENSVPTKSSGTADWYLILIAFLCGILSGIILLFSIQWLKRKMNRQENNATYTEPDHIPKINNDKGVDNVSGYAELSQHTRNLEDNYQPLQNKLRHAAGHIEEPATQESNYQELVDVKGLDSNYECLNRA